MADCEKGNNCFSENGCTHERYKDFPEDNPKLIEMGFKTKCIAQTKCTHDYCGKLKWVKERAEHYAQKTGMTPEQVLENWEKSRTYWYMNYYQENNQPLLESDNIIPYEKWISDLKERFGEDSKNWAFKCPNCGNIQTAQDFIDNGAERHKTFSYYSCIGRYVKNKGCNWTLGGLLQMHKTCVLKDGEVFPVFEMAESPNKK